MDITIPLFTLESRIKRRLRKHLQGLGFIKTKEGFLLPPDESKESLRALHHLQRKERLSNQQFFINSAWSHLREHFADGGEIDVSEISPKLELIQSKTWQSDLFRLAGLTWSVPVSPGYGRRMRFLVWDNKNGKLIGLIGLGDPVFNLKVRDELIGWSADDRRQRLVNVMDAYVLGAVPPYNRLLGGKLVASLVRTKEVRDMFVTRYASTKGIISQERKSASLALVTTSSALGRSSVYNRLSLNGQHYFKPIGYTSGWGHFHIPNDLFELIRLYLEEQGDVYAGNHKFGDGPNWKLRAVRKALSLLGLNPDLLRHGIKREVFACELAANTLSFLAGKSKLPRYNGLLSVAEVSALAKSRWIEPRAARCPDFRYWRNDRILDLLVEQENFATRTAPEAITNGTG